jgi:hypothetical protein
MNTVVQLAVVKAVWTKVWTTAYFFPESTRMKRIPDEFTNS